ncbi:MAG: PIN domain-containing protein [Candidatus Binatia bacterium]
MGAQTREVTRVVLDTNVVLSALLFRTGRLAWIREAWSDGPLSPIVSRETGAELMRALACSNFNFPRRSKAKRLRCTFSTRRPSPNQRQEPNYRHAAPRTI